MVPKGGSCSLGTPATERYGFWLTSLWSVNVGHRSMVLQKIVWRMTLFIEPATAISCLTATDLSYAMWDEYNSDQHVLRPSLVSWTFAFEPALSLWLKQVSFLLYIPHDPLAWPREFVCILASYCLLNVWLAQEDECTRIIMPLFVFFQYAWLSQLVWIIRSRELSRGDRAKGWKRFSIFLNFTVGPVRNHHIAAG